ncbi:MAG: ribulose-phosphate 3-epimerase [Bacteroidota bacterium]|nr:ribulose-phosphate 3-epimerase [Bacteroidota bacterium]
MPILAPSILSADFSELRNQIKLVESGGADWIHCDIMDGHFVPNITFGPLIVKKVKEITSLPVDTHLMISNPDLYLEAFIKAGSDYLTVHQEAVIHLDRTLSHIRELGAKAGVSLNPSTPVSSIADVIDKIDLLLIMSVNPGFGGQSFIKNSLKKIKQAVELRSALNADFIIEVDGGMNKLTIKEALDSGCQAFVAGSSVFGAKDIAASAAELKNIIR